MRPVFHYPPVRNPHRPYRPADRRQNDRQKAERHSEKVAEDVEAGRSVAASFQERGGKLLPAVFIETIRAGEESGNLSKAFETMYQHYDKQVKMRAKVRNALIYPVFVLALAVVVVIVLMVKVVLYLYGHFCIL
ncbi:MAG: type II secretion system F family protein [Ruminococcus sp.]